MANKQISQLTAKPTPVASTDQLAIDDNLSVSYKITIANMETYFNGKYLALAGGTMAGNLTLAGDPSTALMAATKQYVDAVATGLNIQASCVCASTTALTVTYANGASGVGATLTNAGALAAFSVDGVSPTVGQRVLIKNQASSLQNGIYTVTTVGSGATAWVLTRATDFDTPTEIQPGDLVPVTSGTAQSGSSWMQTATVAAVGTDAVTFIQFSASIPVSVPNGGTGLTTTTAYGLITGGTTATGVFQNAGTGTAGQVYVSGGAAALGTWTTRTGTVNAVFSTSPTITTPNIITAIRDTNGNAMIGMQATASAVNYVDFYNAATTNSPTVAAVGTATNLNLNLNAKGTGGVMIQGSTGLTNPAAGQVGETITNSATGVSITTGTGKTITSVTLTPGNWEVETWVGYAPAASTTFTNVVASGSLTDNTAGNFTGTNETYSQILTTFTTGGGVYLAAGSSINRVTTNTPYYAVAFATFAISTMTCSAKIIATRIA